MRVLHVLDLSLPVVAGYTSRARAILENQAAIGIDAMAVTGLRQGSSDVASEHIGGIRHHRTNVRAPLDRLRAAPALRELIEMAAIGGRTVDVARDAEVDVIHAHSPVLCGMPAHAAARRVGLPSVYEIRAFWEDAAANQGRDHEGSPRYAAIRGLETRLVKSVDATVAICEGIRKDLVARGADERRIFVVPNGVDTARFTPCEKDPAFARRFGFEGKTVVAYIGTLFRFEGVGLMLEALARMLDKRDDVRGLVVGYGELEPELKALHAKLGLGDKVVLTGKVAPSEITRYYGLADVLCYPRESHRITELTTPLKPLEAMSMQKAVVCSDVGGLRELVTDRETGLWFAAGDADDFARVLGRLVDDADLRRAIGERARADMIRSRDWTSLVGRYRDVYAAAAEHAQGRKGAVLKAA
jgi:PEP-CTERM/exosortase A-associated glycosyltransferase